MRLWSLHPKYLDAMGLVALWREALLAKSVLTGKTNGYKNHPQMIRFKEKQNPQDAINQYLSYIYNESNQRGYSFNKDKIDWGFQECEITVTREQMEFERNHLLKKLKDRNSVKYNELIKIREIIPNPIFTVIDGSIETWEKI